MEDSRMTLMCLMLLAFMWTCSGRVTKSFPCPASQAVFTIQHEIGSVLTCEQMWVTHNRTIAIYNHNDVQCAVPCVNVSHEGIALSDCVSVVLTITCESHVLTEKRIIFFGKKDSSSPVPVQDHPESTHMHIGLIVTVVIGCSIVVVVISWVMVRILTLARPTCKPDGRQAVQDRDLHSRGSTAGPNAPSAARDKI